MVTAQVLEATHAVDDRVGRVGDGVLDVGNKVAGVDDRVARVDDRVAGVNDRVARVDERVAGVDDGVARVDDRVASVDDRVARVDDRVAGVDDRVAHVDDKVAGIDDKIAVVIDGAQQSLISQQQNIFNFDIVMDQVKRSCSSFCVGIGVQSKASLQGINYDRTFANGSLRPIPLLTTTLPVVPIASKEPSGFSKEVSSPNGNQMVRFCGSTENVRSYISSPMVADSHVLQRALERAYSGLLLSITVSLKLLTPGLAPP